MGAQDSLALAEGFVADVGVSTPLMIWDESFGTWAHYGVAGQPTAILVDAQGQVIETWLGRFDPAEVLGLT